MASEQFARPTPPASADGRPARVLIVDDNHDAAESLGMLLALHGLEVEIVKDGRSALGAAETFRPQLVLLDIGMPDMNGYEVARALRERESLKDITLVALTGLSARAGRQKALDAGFDHHFTKPVDAEAVLGLVS